MPHVPSPHLAVLYYAPSANHPTERITTMARAKKDDTAAKPSDVQKTISTPKLKSLIKNVKGAESDKNEAVGRVASLISNAVEKEHLDKWAFGVLRQLERKSRNKGSISWAQLCAYIQASGLQAEFDEQVEAFDESETGPDPLESATVKPRPGSFAEKVREANSPEAIADRAQARSDAASAKLN